MKKKNFKALDLNKKSISKLSLSETSGVKGGSFDAWCITYGATCGTMCSCPCKPDVPELTRATDCGTCVRCDP